MKNVHNLEIAAQQGSLPAPAKKSYGNLYHQIQLRQCENRNRLCGLLRSQPCLSLDKANFHTTGTV